MFPNIQLFKHLLLISDSSLAGVICFRLYIKPRTIWLLFPSFNLTHTHENQLLGLTLLPRREIGKGEGEGEG